MDDGGVLSDGVDEVVAGDQEDSVAWLEGIGECRLVVVVAGA
jgi:hypothetical protein